MESDYSPQRETHNAKLQEGKPAGKGMQPLLLLLFRMNFHVV